MNLGISELASFIRKSLKSKIHNQFAKKIKQNIQYDNQDFEIYFTYNDFGIPQLMEGWGFLSSFHYYPEKFISIIPIWLLVKYGTIYKICKKCIKIPKDIERLSLYYSYHFKDGKIHNENGPASVTFSTLEYYLNNEPLSKEEWFNELLKLYPEKKNEYLFNQDIYLNSDPNFWLEEIIKTL